MTNLILYGVLGVTIEEAFITTVLPRILSAAVGLPTL